MLKFLTIDSPWARGWISGITLLSLIQMHFIDKEEVVQYVQENHGSPWRVMFLTTMLVWCIASSGAGWKKEEK